MRRRSRKRDIPLDQYQEIASNRKEVLDAIYFDPGRAGKHGTPCEGTLFVPHRCNGPLEGNEVIYPRNVFQKLAPDQWEPFFQKYNMSINCRFFHQTYGHRRAFRGWFISRVTRYYGYEEVFAWNEELPLIESKVIIPND